MERSYSVSSPKKKLLRLCLFVFPEHLGLLQSALVIDRLIAMLLVFKVFSYINAGRIKVVWATFKQENKSLKKQKKSDTSIFIFLQQHILFSRGRGEAILLPAFFPAAPLNLFLKNKIFPY